MAVELKKGQKVNLKKKVPIGEILINLNAFGICFVVFHRDSLFVMISGAFMAALVIFMHRGNIVRLIQGNERKTDLFKKGANS